MNFFNLNQSCLIIAEIGINHNGDLNLAHKLIDAAKKSGADVVKFQTYNTEKLVSINTPKVQYQKTTTSKNESHFEMLKNSELSYEDHIIIQNYCKKVGIEFISTPYDVDSAKFLLELNVNYFKTASADLIDLQLQKYIAETKKPSVVSVGMSSLEEIENTLKIYKTADNPNIALLHCVSNYPCSDQSLNLRVIETLRKKFNLPVGFSDHSVDNMAAILSVSLGACIIEKHFTLDKKMNGPDHQASSTPEEFSSLVNSVRRAEKILGSPEKKCQPEELQMSQVSRKSIHMTHNLKKGEKITIEKIELKRPGGGLFYKDLPNIINKRVNKNIDRGHQLQWSDIYEK